MSLNTNFIILCVTTWSLLNTTILDRSATTASLLSGSSASQDDLQILYLPSFFARLDGDAGGGQHLRSNASRPGSGGLGRRNLLTADRRADHHRALPGFPSFPP